jgi:hypothetical protein
MNRLRRWKVTEWNDSAAKPLWVGFLIAVLKANLFSNLDCRTEFAFAKLHRLSYG